jgi:hypothetical protein
MFWHVLCHLQTSFYKIFTSVILGSLLTRTMRTIAKPSTSEGEIVMRMRAAV